MSASETGVPRFGFDVSAGDCASATADAKATASAGAPAYVKAGSRVTVGQVVCIIEAMKIMNEIEAEIAGVIKEICVENAQPVEFGQVLFRVDPHA